MNIRWWGGLKVNYIIEISKIYDFVDSTPSTYIHWNFSFSEICSNCAENLSQHFSVCSYSIYCKCTMHIIPFVYWKPSYLWIPDIPIKNILLTNLIIQQYSTYKHYYYKHRSKILCAQYGIEILLIKNKTLTNRHLLPIPYMVTNKNRDAKMFWLYCSGGCKDSLYGIRNCNACGVECTVKDSCLKLRRKKLIFPCIVGISYLF